MDRRYWDQGGYYLSAYGIAVKHGFQGTEEEWLDSLKGATGDKGDPGADFKVLGTFETLALLEEAVTDPEIGDVYMVGNAATRTCYMWVSEEADPEESGFVITDGWANIGSLLGPKGDQGEQGVQGDQGEPGRGISYVRVLDSGEIKITYTDGESEIIGRDVYEGMEALLEATEGARDDARTAEGGAQNAADDATNKLALVTQLTEATEAYSTAAGNAQTAAEAAQAAALTSANLAGLDEDKAHGWMIAAETARDKSQAWATGTTDSGSVPSTDPAYENNAKYYAEQAADAAATFVTDTTLAVSGKAADAKSAGDRLTVVEGLLDGKTPLRIIGNLTESTDLNDVMTMGLYSWTGSHRPGNAPSTYAARMLVLQAGGSGNYIQIVFPALPTVMPYIRVYRNNAWTSWLRYADTSIVDSTLSVSGKAADASETGTRLTAVETLLDGKNPLKIIGALTASDDLDNVTDIGVYSWLGSQVPANSPTNFASRLLVLPVGGNACVQMVFTTNTMSAPYVRAMYSGTWRTWYRMATTSQVDAVQESVEEVYDYLSSAYYGKKVSIIGDSISTYSGYLPSGYSTYYPYGEVDDVRLTWWMRFLNTSGAELEVNASYSGSAATAAPSGSSYPDFYDRANTSVIGNPDLIFVELGTNDSDLGVALGTYDYETETTSLSENTFREAYIKGIQTLQTNFPDAEIVCVIADMRTGYRQSIREIAEHYNLRCVDANPYDKIQGHHPSILGNRKIASNILGFADKTLSVYNAAADAATVGDRLTELSNIYGIEIIPFSHRLQSQYTSSAGTAMPTNYPKFGNTYVSAKYFCNPGDTITIKGTAGTGEYRLYGFYNANDISIGRSAENLDGEYEITVPDNAAYIVINARADSEHYAYKHITSNESSIIVKDYTPEETEYTESFSFTVVPTAFSEDQVQVLRAVTKYTSTNDYYPTIRYKLTNGSTSLYVSPYYKLGSAIEMTRQEWRLPAGYKTYKTYVVEVSVPDGVTLNIESFKTHIEAAHPYTGGIEYEAHHGFTGIYPPDTALAIGEAGKLGFGYCTITPKFTADEVPVCFHDDGSIKDQLRYNDGTAITSGSADDKPMWQFTYADVVDRFDAGIKRNALFAGLKVPTVDKFFEICAKSGMSACMSVHGNTGFNESASSGCVSTAAEATTRWQTIYNLAKKWGLLGKIYIKSSAPGIQSLALGVFGNKAKYIMIQGISSSWDPLSQAKLCGFVPSTATSMSESDYTVYFEWFETGVTDEKIALAKSEGFETLQIAEVNKLTGEQMRAFIEKGVTRFTLDYHCSAGLDW